MNIILIGGGESKSSITIARNIIECSKGCDITFIPFANNPKYKSHDEIYLEYKKVFDQKGFTHFKKVNTVEELTKTNNDSFYIGGGNTFNLMNLVMTSQLKDILSAKIKANSLIIGSSAGAIILGKTIQFAHDTKPDKIIQLDGLNLMNNITVFPHYKPEKHDAEINAALADGFKFLLLPEKSAVHFNGHRLLNIGEVSPIIRLKDKPPQVIDTEVTIDSIK